MSNQEQQNNTHDIEQIALLEKELRHIAALIKQKGREILKIGRAHV